jgi:hypothetical protein
MFDLLNPRGLCGNGNILSAVCIGLRNKSSLFLRTGREKPVQLAIRSYFPPMPRIPGLRGLAVVLLCTGLTGCQRHAPPTPPSRPPAAAAVQPPAEVVPSRKIRSLLPEIDEAKFGAAAQVRTQFGKGSGLVLPEEHEVLAHLHVVLTPKKKIAEHIFVNLSASPARAHEERHAYVIAQDPTHDLVLLKVGTAPASSQSAPQAKPSTRQKAPSHDARHHRARRRRRRRRLSRADAAGTTNPATTKKSDFKIKTHVVYDGPDDVDNNKSRN